MISKRGISKNLFALFFGLSLNTTIQVLTVPILLNAFEISEYQEWLIAISYAQIFSIADFGIISALQNKFVLYIRRGQAVVFEQQILSLFTFLVLGYFITGLTICSFTFFAATQLNVELFLVFAFSNFMSSSFALFEGVARAHGEAHIGLFRSGILRLIDFIGILIALLLNIQSLTQVALIGLILKFISWLYLSRITRLQYSTPTLKLGKINDLPQLLKEGFPFLIIRLSDFTSNSLIIIVLSHFLSAEKLVFFATLKTFFRIGLQFSTVVNYLFWYELTDNWASSDFANFSRNNRLSTRVTFILSLTMVVLYLIVGTPLFEI